MVSSGPVTFPASSSSLLRIVASTMLCAAWGGVYHPGDGGAAMNLGLRLPCRRVTLAVIAAAAVCAFARQSSADEVLPCRDLLRPDLAVKEAGRCGAKTITRPRSADGASELLNLGIRHAEAGRHGQA